MEEAHSEKSTTPALEYNLAGGLLLTVGTKDFQELLLGLKDSGYSSACVLPFRALRKKEGIESLRRSGLSIVHLEEAWNPTTEDSLTGAVLAGLVGYYRRFRGLPGDNPILQDSLFPSKATCAKLFTSLLEQFPDIEFISHQIDVDFPRDRLLVEINPGVNLSPIELLAKARKEGIGLVFDPSHLLHTGTTVSLPGKPTHQISEWEKQWRTFSSQVRVVDINPPNKKKDIDLLLKGQGVLKELAQAAQEPHVEFLRVEIPIPLSKQIPGLRPHTAGFNFLKEIGEALQ